MKKRINLKVVCLFFYFLVLFGISENKIYGEINFSGKYNTDEISMTNPQEGEYVPSYKIRGKHQKLGRYE